MSHTHSSEPHETREPRRSQPSAFKLHRLGWNGGEASVEQGPAQGPGAARDTAALRADVDGAGVGIQTVENSPIDTPAVIAARLTGTRRAFIEILADADLITTTTHHPHHVGFEENRAAVMVNPQSRIIWDSSPFPGSVITAYDVEKYVIDRLGELWSDYDVASIVAAIRDTDWWPVPDRPLTILDEMPGISAIVEQHDLRPRNGSLCPLDTRTPS